MASTTGSNMSSLQTLIFTGKNYEYWSLTMKALFRGQDVWEIVQYSYAEPADQGTYNNLTQVEKDGKALLYIHQAVHESILPRVAVTIIAKKAWDTLETSYQGFDKVKTYKLQILRRYFEYMSMKYT